MPSTTDFSSSPRKGTEWYLDTQSPHLYEGGALRHGGEVNIWSRDYIGLVVQYAAVGMIFGTLPGTVYPFLFNYLNMEGTQVVSAVVLLNMPWSFKLFYGMLTDCIPIWGYRRRPFMVIGWTICFATNLIQLWDEHLAPFLTLNEAVALAELSRFFYAVVHKHIRLRAEASLVCTVPELLRVLGKWRNLRNVAFQPVGNDFHNGEAHESIHYNVNATGGLIVDLDLNQPAPEPEPSQVPNESYTDEDGVSVPERYSCPNVLQNCIRDSNDGQVKRLNLSGIVRVNLFDGVNQLQELGLSGCSQIDGLHWLSGIREVDMSYCNFLENVSFLSRSQHVDLSYCHSVTDLTPLANCESVQLNVCRGVHDVSPLSNVRRVSLRNCPQVADVSSLSNVHELNLGGCANVTNVSMLGSVYELNLSGCVNVTDVSALGKVHTLKLRKCLGIVDVSALGGVQDLDLTGCINVTDVSALGRVPKLELALCRYVSGISALGNGVRELSLRQCDAIKDLSALATSSSLRELDLSSCTGFATSELQHLPPLDRLVLSRCSQLTNLDGLTRVRELDVSFCKNLRSLGSSLRGVHTIVTYRCEKLEDIEVLAESASSLTKVNLSGCSRIRDISFLAGARDVDLRFCDSLEDVRPLAGSARIVKLAGCSKLVDVSPLARSRELDLSYCPCIEDVSALEAVHTLSLRHCPNIRDVSALASVHTLNLSGCTRLGDVSALKSVHELNLSDCCKVTDVGMLTGVRVLDLRYNKSNSDALKAGVAKLRGLVPIIRM
ncbi:unnamed protein product [Phytophthora lilii]|uniref:Unnamed protein product n=1 Tax=Phytophthora lilii TaxID=2077276 RepID=A0A9W6TWK2_9STRA|nr:unnamed protein product [Phytophthora lilii]